jgi:hypothetical protein
MKPPRCRAFAPLRCSAPSPSHARAADV